MRYKYSNSGKNNGRTEARGNTELITFESFEYFRFSRCDEGKQTEMGRR